MKALLLRFVPGLLPALSSFANPWVLLALTAALILFGLKCYNKGVRDTEAEQTAERIVIIKKVEVLREVVRVPYLKKETEIVEVFRFIEKEAEHVPSRAACNATAGWLRLHDAAAGGDRRPEGAVDDPTDSGIAEGRILAEVIIPNYEDYHQVANALRACRAFAGGLKEATSPR